jgi:hypothetical protein
VRCPMNLHDLARYDRFYTNAAQMGVNAIFRDFFGLAPDHPVPLSVAHGVDFGHSFYPQDVLAAEPIHWSCNDDVHRQALAYKPSILLPHPWIMLSRQAEVPEGKGTLIIGPPPGPVNDERLFRLIEGSLSDDSAILIKVRGAYRDSFRFWQERGVTPVTAGAPDDQFYPRLLQMLGSYRRILGPTFSSALVFAAAIGRQVDLVRGFTYRAVERRDYETEVNWASERARAVVGTFSRDDHAAKQRLASEILGGGLAFDRAAKIAELHALIASLPGPFWMNPAVRFPPPRVRRALATVLGKTGLVNAGLGTYYDRFRRADLAIMTVNEFDIWLNGKSPENFDLQPIVESRKNARPGLAAERYEQ